MTGSYGVVDDGFVSALRNVVGSQYVLLGDKLKYASRDRSFHPPSNPEVLVRPRSTKEVAEVVHICDVSRIPITPRGAGTGLEGGAIPYCGGVVLDSRRLDSIEVDNENMLVVVGPGVKKNTLNKHLLTYGFVLGPDPASNPSVGGMCSTGASGMSTQMYGTTKENVVSLTVVSPDGSIIKTRSLVRKSSTGYELTQLYLGSEGTLGIVTEIVFKLWRFPVVRCGAVVRFTSVNAAATSVMQIRKVHLLTLARCELLNAECIKAVNKKDSLALEPVPTLFLEFHAPDVDGKAHTLADWEKVLIIVKACMSTGWTFASEGSDLDQIWSARRGCYIASISYRGSVDMVYISDVCVPMSKIAQCISETEDDFASHGFCCIICAHIIDGNFHCCIPYQPSNPAERAQMNILEERMIDRAIALGGTVSGEHGVGIGKMQYILKEHGQINIEIMRKIKTALDPHNIMNPGKIFDLQVEPRL